MAIDRTLVQIRERSYLDLLDLALVVVRQRLWALAGAAAAGILPWSVLYAWLAADAGFPPFFLVMLLAFASPWATAPLTITLGGLMFGERPPAGRVARTLVRKLPALVLYQGLLRGVLLGTFLLSFLIPTQLAFLDEVILLERARGDEKTGQSVYARCSVLCGSRGGELFLQCLAQLVFTVMFVLAFRWATEALLDVLFRELTWGRASRSDPEAYLEELFFWFFDLRAWTAQLGLWISVAFFGLVRFLIYIDTRIRLEGWEVELRLRAAGATLEDAERW
ncbi:MAG: hypothetical protein IRY99_27060 [Isosphaeraceae bacterium]|nr:hypothetical protein [Isosphaeraceae bacterium]